MACVDEIAPAPPRRRAAIVESHQSEVVRAMSYSARTAAALRTRYRLLMAAVTIVLLLALGGMLFLAGDAGPTAEDLDCAERYAQARSAADTARVDAAFPYVTGRGSGRASSRSLVTLGCGARRTSGRIPASAR